MEWYQGDLQAAVVAEDWPKVSFCAALFKVLHIIGTDLPISDLMIYSIPFTADKRIDLYDIL